MFSVFAYFSGIQNMSQQKQNGNTITYMVHIMDKILSRNNFDDVGDCHLEPMWIFSFALKTVKVKVKVRHDKGHLG